MKKNGIKTPELVIYQAKNGAIELRGDFREETFWATLDQIATIFGRDKSVISRHLKNIFKEVELDRDSVVAKNATTAADGKTYQVEYYNLDVMLSVGYRVNSKTATQFRQWATKTLRQHIVEGYTINPSRIATNYDKFQLAVTEVQKLLPAGNVISADDILELVKAFAGTWFSLESYDESNLPSTGKTKRSAKLQSAELYRAVELFKSDLQSRGEASDLFAQEKHAGALEGIVGNVMQSAFGAEVYKTVEEKAAHLLYFVVKNHVFNDGNKRTGAFAFIWFLRKAKLANRYKITPEALTAVTLLVAESKPDDKDRIIGVILLLLSGK